MGSSWFRTKEEQRVESTPLTKIFEKECPYYMSYGMTYDEYWYDDCFKVKFYREMYKIQLKNEDRNMWKQGMYIYEALCDVSPILHAFSKNGTKPLPYRTKPMLEENEELLSNKEKEKKVENERLKAQIFFNNWARATAKHFENEKR